MVNGWDRLIISAILQVSTQDPRDRKSQNLNSKTEDLSTTPFSLQQIRLFCYYDLGSPFLIYVMKKLAIKLPTLPVLDSG